MAVRGGAEAFAVRVLSLLHRRDDDGGQGMVEYAMIMMMVAIALILIVTVLGKQTVNMYSNISNGLNQ